MPKKSEPTQIALLNKRSYQKLRKSGVLVEQLHSLLESMQAYEPNERPGLAEVITQLEKISFKLVLSNELPANTTSLLLKL